MKQSQWAVAAIVLAALVFIVTFAMNFLGGGRRTAAKSGEPRREIHFGLTQLSFGDADEQTRGHMDYWFVNENKKEVKVGLAQLGCSKCTSADIFLLSDDGKDRMSKLAGNEPLVPWLQRAMMHRNMLMIHRARYGQVLQMAATTADLLLTSVQSNAATPWRLAWQSCCLSMVGEESVLSELEKSASPPQTLQMDQEPISVPAGAAGWVRMHWKDRSGRQTFTATLWMDAPDAKITLATPVSFHPPIRVRPTLAMGVLRDENLGGAGVTRQIVCWSSTRSSLRLEAKSAQGRLDPASDPFIVGQPVALTDDERRELQEANNPKHDAQAKSLPEFQGPVLCAYRISVTIRGMSADGKTPFDLGLFHRRVTLKSAGAPGDGVQVTVIGRVRGDVEIGNDEDGGEISFGMFPSRKGKREKINVRSDAPGMKLTFDRERTPPFLTADPGTPTIDSKGRQLWTLRVGVPPREASGIFPRREDPRYEDSAVYLKTVVPNKSPRSIRIAVQGTANES